MKNYHRGFTLPTVMAIIAIVVLGAGVYMYAQKNPSFTTNLTTKVSENTKISTTFDDSDLKISYAPISSSDNSASIFNKVKVHPLAQTDLDFTKRYFSTYSSKNLPPVIQSEKILASYPDLLKIFDENAHTQYQCSINRGETCPLQLFRTVVPLVALQALVHFQHNESSKAQTIASDIITLGKNITAHTADDITLLVGWSIQNLGYSLLPTVHSKKDPALFSESEKTNLISQLRQEQKNVLRSDYTSTSEGIDYITSPDNKPSILPTPDEEKVIALYRKGVATSPTSWNPAETKKYFYDSYKIALANVDLACGATRETSMVNINFNPQDQKAENYVGKTIYITTYASLDSFNQKRCDLENLIKNL